jgi:predicted MPP superfamily phosphohydrolase
MNFLSCKKCGQKYNVPFIDSLRLNIEKNVTGLLKKYGKVAVWGINYHTSDLFKNSAVLKDKNVYPVDISETKRKMELFGKKIFCPEIIEVEGIKAVIISVPVYFTQIKSQIEASHKNVRDIIDICSLIDPSYKP